MTDHSLQDGPLHGGAGAKLVRLRWLIVAAWLGAAALLLAFVPAVDPAANELLTFLPDDSPSLRAAGLLREYFPESAGLSQAVVVVSRTDGALTLADLLSLGTLVKSLRGPLPESVAANLPTDRLPVRWEGDLPPPMMPNPFISSDGAVTIAVVEIPANFVTVRSARAVQHVRTLVDRHNWPEGLEVAVTGSAAYGADYAEATNRSHDRTLWVTVAAVLVILLIIYRAPVAAFLVLGTISLAAVVAHQLLSLASRYGLHVGTAERIFVFVLLYGLGVDYSLLYLSRFHEYLREGIPGPRAAGRAWSASMPAIAASSGTDIIGLAMLSAASFKIFRTTGHAVPIALLVALAAAMTLIPATAAVLHRWLFWPSKRMGHIGGRHIWPAIAGMVTRRPGWVLAVTLIVLAVPAALALRIEYVYDALTGLNERYGAVRGRQIVEKHWSVGNISPISVVVTAEGAAGEARLEPLVAPLTKALGEAPGVTDVRSLSQPLGKTGKSMFAALALLQPAARQKVRAAYVSTRPAAAVTRLEVVLDSPGFSTDAMAALDGLRQACDRVLPAGVACHFSGATPYMADVRAVTARDFYLIAGLVLAVVFVLVLILLRDAVLSGFMIAATAFSYLATLGITQIFFVGIVGWEGLDWKVQVFLFVVMVAVGQDYNIFLAARLAEESRTSPPREAARIAIIRTGSIISSAGVIMAATLGSLMVGDISLLVQLGFAFALGMLLDTFIIRPLLLPAFAVLTGHTGKPIVRRRKGRVGEEETPA